MIYLNKMVSIIIPCYNQGKFLDEALQSVLNQTYKNWECIIVNDGSTDNSEVIAKSWIIKDARFTYFHKENGGVSSSRNLGIKKAKGGFIQFLDADDILAKDKITISMAAIQEHSVAVVCTNYAVFEESVAKLQPAFSQLSNFEFTFYNLARYWNDGFTIPIHCWFFKADLLKNNWFPEGLTAQEDWFMWLRIFQKNPKTYYVAQVLAFYRINLSGRTKTSGFFEETIAVIQLMKPHLNDTDFQILYESVIRRYNCKMLYSRNKEICLKRSNTYQTGLFIKKIFKIFGLLPLGRTLFPFILKLKSK